MQRSEEALEETENVQVGPRWKWESGVLEVGHPTEWCRQHIWLSAGPKLEVGMQIKEAVSF